MAAFPLHTGELMKILAQLTLLVTVFTFAEAHAGTQALGFEISVSTVDQVKASLAKQTKVEDVGINKFSGGPMLTTTGTAYEIEGLNEVTYIFDEQKKLAGVLMDMSKTRFDSVYQALAGKYKVASQQRPFVGNQYARFKTQDAVIEIDAPHLSFQMAVRYIRNDLMQKFNSKTTAENEAKKKSESAKF
jgi:hypothetical protein